MKNIEHYCDYREYLKDFYNESKEKHSFFSYRYFTRKAGLASPSLFREVVAGTRNITGQSLPLFIKGLGLNEKDASFFTALIHFNQAKDARMKNKHLEEMRNLLPKLHEHTVHINFYALYSKWYNLAIREAACAFDWKDDYGKLADFIQPNIRKAEAKEAVKLLLDLGFLVKMADGSYQQKDIHITTSPEVVSTSIRNLNHQFANLGTEAIHFFPPTIRDISSMTLGISKENYQLIKQEILSFRDRVKRIVDGQDHMNAVYNLNVQLFPLSKEIAQ